MARTLTKRQKGFARDYIETGVGTIAARKNYNISNDNSAAAVASELLTVPKVKQYIESKTERAAERIVELSEQEENLPVSLGATKDILDRGGLAVVSKSETKSVQVNLSGNILAQPELEALRSDFEEKLKTKLLHETK